MFQVRYLAVSSGNPGEDQDQLVVRIAQVYKGFVHQDQAAFIFSIAKELIKEIPFQVNAGGLWQAAATAVSSPVAAGIGS